MRLFDKSSTNRDRYWHLGGRQRMMQMLGNLIDPVDFPELLQKLRVTIVEAHDLPELRPETRFVLYNFPPDFDLAEQKRPNAAAVPIFLFCAAHVPARIDSAPLYIAPAWRLGRPY